MFEEQKAKIRRELIDSQCRYHKRNFKKSCKECKAIQISRAIAIAIGRAIVLRYNWLENMK